MTLAVGGTLNKHTTKSPFDFKYCVILIYRLKVSDRASAGNFQFPYKLWWVKRIFTIENVLNGI